MASSMAPRLAHAAAAIFGPILDNSIRSHVAGPRLGAMLEAIWSHCQPFRMDSSHLSNHCMDNGISREIPHPIPIGWDGIPLPPITYRSHPMGPLGWDISYLSNRYRLGVSAMSVITYIVLPRAQPVRNLCTYRLVDLDGCGEVEANMLADILEGQIPFADQT